MDIKHKQLYVAYDKYTDMYKIGSASNVTHRLLVLKSAIKRPLELIYSTPGSDYFLREISMPRATHPVKHDGCHEWFHNTPDFHELLKTIKYFSAALDITGLISHAMMHKYTEEAS